MARGSFIPYKLYAHICCPARQAITKFNIQLRPWVTLYTSAVTSAGPQLTRRTDPLASGTSTQHASQELLCMTAAPSHARSNRGASRGVRGTSVGSGASGAQENVPINQVWLEEGIDTNAGSYQARGTSAVESVTICCPVSIR